MKEEQSSVLSSDKQTNYQSRFTPCIQPQKPFTDHNRPTHDKHSESLKLTHIKQIILLRIIVEKCKCRYEVWRETQTDIFRIKRRLLGVGRNYWHEIRR